jgi:C4-dicarboxylate-specific signal transduction histidine kinase
MRVAVLGELSGAIAHEINQPLTAILSNAQAALHLLAEKPPDLAEVRGTLEDIVHEDHRASEVIQRLRNLLRKGERKSELVDVNNVVNSTIALRTITDYRAPRERGATRPLTIYIGSGC